jgi:sugar lactone lactonase YvrE
VEIPAGCTAAGCQSTIGSGWTSPQSVAVDAAGDVIVADPGLNGDAGGVVEVPAGCTSSACQVLLWTDEPAQPFYVAVNAAGQVFVANDGANPVVEINQPQPPSETFVNTTVGLTSTQSFTALNVGNQPLSFFELNFPSGFLQTDLNGTPPDCSFNSTLSPGQGCNLSIEFEPTLPQVYNALANLQDTSLNGDFAIQVFNLSGIGEAPTINELDVTFTGAGSGTVIDNLSIPETDCIETNGVLSGACSENYPSASYPTVTLTATPSAGSTFAAWGGACASAGTNPQCVVTMTPMTTVAAAFSPETFGNISACAGGVAAGCIAKTLAVTMNLPSSTTVASINVVTQGANNLDFTLNAGSGCTGFVGPGICTVNVDFAPTAPGLRLGAVELLDGSGTVLATQLVYGIGQGALAAFTPFSTVVVPAGTLTGPKGVLVDAAGDLFVSDYDGHKVVEIGPSTGNQVVTIAQSPQVHNPQDMAMDGAGNLYVADTNIPGVLKISPNCIVTGSSTCQQVLPNPLNLTGQFGVSVDAQGDVFVSAYNQNEVVEVPVNGGTQTVVYNGVTPIGTAVDAAGDLFVADAGGQAIVKVPAGCSSPSCYTRIGSGWTSPESVALDAAGDLYVVDGASNQDVVEFPAGCTTNTCSITVASRASPSLGANFAPYDAVTDAQGNVYIGDYSNQRVDEIPRSQPPSLNFGSVNVGARSSDIGFTIQNVGNQALTGTLAPASNSNFAEDQVNSTCGNGNPFSISAGGSCVEGIYAQPQVGGPLSGSATVSDNSLNGAPAMQVIPLAATGVATSYTVTVTAGEGAGSGLLTSTPTGINCSVAAGVASGTCSASFPIGTAISIGESPSPGSTFTGWGGVCSGTYFFCSVSGNADASVSASFASSTTNTLTVTDVGTGSGTVTDNLDLITCIDTNGSVTGTCSASYTNATVTLTATPSGNSIFAGWGGACASSATSPTCVVTMIPAVNVTATFVAPGSTQPGTLEPITAGVVYGQGSSFTSNTHNNGGVSANSLADPAGSVLDSNGNLYVGDTGNNRVLFYPRGSTTPTRVYGQGGSFATAGNNQGGISANSLNNPYGVALDSSGNLYVADLLNNRVLSKSAT